MASLNLLARPSWLASRTRIMTISPKKRLASSMVTQHFDVAIVGGGLSGLLTARRILQMNSETKITILESQNRFGGRLVPGMDDAQGAWSWNSDQTGMSDLVQKLGLSSVSQQGAMKSIQYRVEGGAYKLIDILVTKLENQVDLNTNRVVTDIKLKDALFELKMTDTAKTKDTSPQQIALATVVIVATPPCVALDTISFEPSLPAKKTLAMKNTPAWIHESPRDLDKWNLSPDPELSVPLHDGYLLFAGSESAPSWPGTLEGAIVSADRTAEEAASALDRKEKKQEQIRKAGQKWVEINSDKNADCLVNIGDVEPTKAGGMSQVTRHIYERLGGEEARATTKVTFEPNSHFPEHEHVGGEEFVVLNGVWRDRWGAFPKFSYVRNYIGSRHSPLIGEEGVEIMVKLRQMTREYPEPENSHVDFSPPVKGGDGNMPAEWQLVSIGVYRKELFKSPFETVYAEWFEPNVMYDDETPQGMQETLVALGSYSDFLGEHKLHAWSRYGHDGVQRKRTAGTEGVLLYVKQGHRDMPEVGAPKI